MSVATVLVALLAITGCSALSRTRSRAEPQPHAMWRGQQRTARPEQEGRTLDSNGPDLDSASSQMLPLLRNTVSPRDYYIHKSTRDPAEPLSSVKLADSIAVTAKVQGQSVLQGSNLKSGTPQQEEEEEAVPRAPVAPASGNENPQPTAPGQEGSQEALVNSPTTTGAQNPAKGTTSPAALQRPGGPGEGTLTTTNQAPAVSHRPAPAGPLDDRGKAPAAPLGQLIVLGLPGDAQSGEILDQRAAFFANLLPHGQAHGQGHGQTAQHGGFVANGTAAVTLVAPLGRPFDPVGASNLHISIRLIVASVVAALGAAAANAAGAGGGGIFVPLLTLLLTFDTKTAAAISKTMILGGALATLCFNSQLHHPKLPRPIIHFDLARLMQPMMLLGISMGVACNVMFPAWLITTLLCIALSGITVTTVQKGMDTWRKEEQDREAAAEAALAAAAAEEARAKREAVRREEVQKRQLAQMFQFQTIESGRSRSAFLNACALLGSPSRVSRVLSAHRERQPSPKHTDHSTPMAPTEYAQSGGNLSSAENPATNAARTQAAAARTRRVHHGVPGATYEDQENAQPQVELVVRAALNLGSEWRGPEDDDEYAGGRVGLGVPVAYPGWAVATTRVPSDSELGLGLGVRQLSPLKLDETIAARPFDLTLASMDEGAKGVPGSNPFGLSLSSVDTPENSSVSRMEEDFRMAASRVGSKPGRIGEVRVAPPPPPPFREIVFPFMSESDEWALLQIVVLWAIFLVLQLVKSISEPCSLPFWILNACQIPLSLLATALGVLSILKRRRERARLAKKMGDDVNDDEIKWTDAMLVCLPAWSFLAGVMGGLLGIGGGMVIAPLLHQIGLNAQVAAATSMFLVLFSSSLSVAEFSLMGRIPFQISVYFCALAVTAALVGLTVIRSYIARTGRSSFLILLLGGVIGASGILLGTLSLLGLYGDLQGISGQVFLSVPEPLCLKTMTQRSWRESAVG